MDEVVEHDSVNHPNYYVFPNGAEVIWITQWLTSAGAQAVQYVARATRIDGVVKGNRVEDIEKAQFWLEIERKRLMALVSNNKQDDEGSN